LRKLAVLALVGLYLGLAIAAFATYTWWDERNGTSSAGLVERELARVA
jgi:hypothetical protein